MSKLASQKEDQRLVASIQDSRSVSSVFYEIRQIDLYGNEHFVTMCKNEDEAEKIINGLNEALPKGVLLWYYKRKTIQS